MASNPTRVRTDAPVQLDLSSRPLHAAWPSFELRRRMAGDIMGHVRASCCTPGRPRACIDFDVGYPR